MRSAKHWCERLWIKSTNKNKSRMTSSARQRNKCVPYAIFVICDGCVRDRLLFVAVIFLESVVRAHELQRLMCDSFLWNAHMGKAFSPKHKIMIIVRCIVTFDGRTKMDKIHTIDEWRIGEISSVLVWLWKVNKSSCSIRCDIKWKLVSNS